MTLKNCSRREFLKATGLSASGLIVGFRVFSSNASAQAASAGAGVFEPNAFIAISETKGVTISIASPEIGQNIRTTFAMITADELGADLDSVTLHQAPPRGDMGRQVAGGSGSVRLQCQPTREAAAAAREMLIAAAAAEWGVSPSACRAEAGMVRGPDGKSVPIEKIAAKAASQPVPSAPKLRPASELRYIGKSRLCMDSTDIVTGKTAFGMDPMPENLAFAVMLRCPVRQGKLKSFDASAARQMPGVKEIFQVGDKVAVVASNTWAAINASRTVQVDWDPGENGTVDSEAKAAERKQAVRNPRRVIHEDGDFESAFADAAVKVEEEFVVPTIAHVSLEPPTGTAWVRDGEIEIWGSCQVLNRLYDNLPKMTGFPREKITYHQLRIGGGFGRKLKDDYLQETIDIAKQVEYPVKMIFTREDDIHNDFYRVPDHYRFRVGLGAEGYPEAIEESSVRRGRKGASEITRYFGNATRKFTKVNPGIPGGALRAPNHNITTFVDECLLDILAAKAGIDPIDYRLALHGDPEMLERLGWKRAPRKEPIVCDLLKRVREQSGWKSDSNYGYGVATFSGYGSHCALVALVPKNGGKRPVERVYAAVHCGQVINPLGAEAQIEGGIVDCLSATLYQKITLKEGRVQQNNFHDYKLLRMAEHPDIDISIVDSQDDPGGLGEVSYPPMAAATTNALFDATGNRYTELPLRG